MKGAGSRIWAKFEAWTVRAAWPDAPTYSRECPHCHHSIYFADINLEQRVALCPTCGRQLSLEEVTGTQRLTHPQDVEPRQGCSIRGTIDDAELFISTRQLLKAVALLAVATFLGTVSSFFGLFIFVGLWSKAFGYIPQWLPGQVMFRGNSPPIGWGIMLFFSLFFVPLMVLTTYILYGVVFHLFGSCRGRVTPTHCLISVGVGPLRRTRAFDPREVRRIGIAVRPSSEGSETEVCVVTDKQVCFGKYMPFKLQNWLCAVLSRLLRQPGAKDPSTLFNSPPLN